MDVEIDPEPSEAERRAILAALALERTPATEAPSPWWRAGVDPELDEGDL